MERVPGLSWTSQIQPVWVVLLVPLLVMHGYCDNVDDLSNRNLFSNSFAGSTSKVTVSAGLVSPETFLLGLQMAAFLLGLHAVAPRPVSSSPLLARTWVILNKAHPYDLILPYFTLYMTLFTLFTYEHGSYWIRPTHMTWFYLIYLSTGPVPNIVTCCKLRDWDLNVWIWRVA